MESRTAQEDFPTSCIRINGRPILPVRVDDNYKNEIAKYKAMAIARQKKLEDAKKAKHKQLLQDIDMKMKVLEEKKRNRQKLEQVSESNPKQPSEQDSAVLSINNVNHVSADHSRKSNNDKKSETYLEEFPLETNTGSSNIENDNSFRISEKDNATPKKEEHLASNDTELNETNADSSSDTGLVEDLIKEFSQHSLQTPQSSDQEEAIKDEILSVKNLGSHHTRAPETSDSTSLKMPTVDNFQFTSLRNYSPPNKDIYHSPTQEDNNESVASSDDSTVLQAFSEDRPSSRRRLNMDQVVEPIENPQSVDDVDDAKIRSSYEIKRASPSRIVIARPQYIFDDSMDPFDTDDSIETVPMRNDFSSETISKEQIAPIRAWMELHDINFDKVSAIAKGFLTRLLIRTERVQAIIQTIKDSNLVLHSLKDDVGNTRSSIRDFTFRERILSQLKAARYSLNDIFISAPSHVRMNIIANDRLTKNSRQSSAKSKPLGLSRATRISLNRRLKSAFNQFFLDCISNSSNKTTESSKKEKSKILTSFPQPEQSVQSPYLRGNKRIFGSSNTPNVARASQHNRSPTVILDLGHKRHLESDPVQLKKSRPASAIIERGYNKKSVADRVTLSSEFLRRNKLDQSPKTVSPYSRKKGTPKNLNSKFPKKTNYGGAIPLARNISKKI
ncbi:Centriolar coiled-coil protein of 110 kDa [Trichoplax sp. H2]|nr:Centriolar coiled-coil protein of 110 kDa [Trichoplax sp. H2]|eukprot:RDD37099.1 Centriolar coiled-coil protein of 110 kDa [Trichoplax sp. H2]